MTTYRDGTVEFRQEFNLGDDLTLGRGEVIVTRSAGTDGAIVIFIDTQFEPNGLDGGPGLRVRLNDSDIYVGRAYRSEKTA